MSLQSQVTCSCLEESAEHFLYDHLPCLILITTNHYDTATNLHKMQVSTAENNCYVSLLVVWQLLITMENTLLFPHLTASVLAQQFFYCCVRIRLQRGTCLTSRCLAMIVSAALL
jgi:hypothetical protein